MTAAPLPHEEHCYGVRLYERLSTQAGPVRHGPSGTSWVYAYRGVTGAGQPVMLFRPGDWLLGLEVDGAPRGASILADVGDRALRAEAAPAGCFAIVAAPPGVRLRALALAAAARGVQLPDAVLLDLAARSGAALERGGGDTFVGWDGQLWLAPAFPASFRDEQPSLHGDEVYDALVIDGPERLREVLLGTLPPPLFGGAVARLRAEAAGQVAAPARAPAPPGIGRELAAVLESEEGGAPFFARCLAALHQLGRPRERTLGDVARALLPAAYARQMATLR